MKNQCGSTPLIVFSKGTDYAFEKLAHTKFDCLGLCYTSDINDVRQRIGGSGKALMGNLDPCCIYASNNNNSKITN